MAYLVNKSKSLIKNLERVSFPRKNSRKKITKKITNTLPLLKSQSKPKQVWVRKDSYKCYVIHIAFKAQNTSHWYFDSGCSRHMTGNKALFSSLSENKDGAVTFGDGSKSNVLGK